MIEETLFTSAAGFIGFHLPKSLFEDGYEFLGIDNLSNYYDPKLMFSWFYIFKNYQKFKFEKINISFRKPLTKVFKDYNKVAMIDTIKAISTKSVFVGYDKFVLT